MFKILWLIFVCFITMEPLNSQAGPSQSDYCMGQELDDFVANPSNCKLFYWCGENGEAIMAACPGNMLFNPQTQLCDNAEHVQCDAITNTTNSSEIIITDIPSPQADRYCNTFHATQHNFNFLVFLPHPRNCQQYYMCYHGQALLLACSPKLHWNSKLGKCDLPFNVECFRSVLKDEEDDEDEDDEEEEEEEEQEPGYAIRCPSYGEHIFPNINHCGSFIYCVKGQAVMQSCPFYHFFDVESSRCKWRSKATCVKDLNLKYRKRTFRKI